jgi:hypothetical protein
MIVVRKDSKYGCKFAGFIKLNLFDLIFLVFYFFAKNVSFFLPDILSLPQPQSSNKLHGYFLSDFYTSYWHVEEITALLVPTEMCNPSWQAHLGSSPKQPHNPYCQYTSNNPTITP